MNQPCVYRVSVKGIEIDQKGRILLSRESNGMWDMLGGGLEYNESPIDCLKREIKEETGINVISASPQPLFFITGKRFNHDTYVAHIVYEVKLENLNFRATDECQELKYFNSVEMIKQDLYPTVKTLAVLLKEFETTMSELSK